MTYPHRVKVERAAAGGSTDPDTGVFTPGGAATVIHDGPGDVQDVGESRPRNSAGMPQLNSEASVFLLDESAIMDVMPGDQVTVGWESAALGFDVQRTSDAEVAFARVIDGSLLLRFL